MFRQYLGVKRDVYYIPVDPHVEDILSALHTINRLQYAYFIKNNVNGSF